METREKDIVIEKIKERTPEQVEKVLIFIAGLEAGSGYNRGQSIKYKG